MNYHLCLCHSQGLSIKADKMTSIFPGVLESPFQLLSQHSTHRASLEHYHMLLSDVFPAGVNGQIDQSVGLEPVILGTGEW